MVSIVDCPRRAPFTGKPESPLQQDESLSYVQPAKRKPIVYVRPYAKPSPRIESETTYSLSYMKFDRAPRTRTSYGKYERRLAEKPGKIDFDTVYELSYHAATGKKRRAFVHKPCLSINGVHDMTTTQKLSYTNPGYVKTISCQPYRGKTEFPMSMDHRSVMKESYRDFGDVEVKRPRKRDFWQTKYKTDYSTTNQMSYQYVEPSRKKIRVPYQPPVTAKIESETIYSASYQVPGRFVAKENSLSE